MKAMRYLMLVAVTALTVLAPLHDASAWDSGGGYRGGHGGYWGGYQGGHGGYWGGGYYRGYRGGCWGCDTASAAIVGLAIGGIIGSAIAEASRPPVVVRYPALPPPGRCDSVMVDGVPYYNCGHRGVDDWRDW